MKHPDGTQCNENICACQAQPGTTYLMNPATGNVDTLEQWRAEYDAILEDERTEVWGGQEFEDARLAEVVPNIEGITKGYNPAYGEWIAPDNLLEKEAPAAEDSQG